MLQLLYPRGKIPGYPSDMRPGGLRTDMGDKEK
jgi:hypothetical protein